MSDDKKVPGALILKVLVGSRAHGLDTPFSDYDHRGVFMLPTRHFFRLDGQEPPETSWLEGDPSQAHDKKDDTSWELGHFLKLAVQCNPSILEVFAAPIVTSTDVGDQLRDLFPYIWDPRRVVEAFCGYGYNQRTKLLKAAEGGPEHHRLPKYATAFYRVLLQAEHLLMHKRLPVGFTTHPQYGTLMLMRSGMVTPGQVIDKCAELDARVRELGLQCDQKPDLTKVSDWYESTRRENF